MTEAEKARFWGRVRKSDTGCWLWLGWRLPSGYGMVRYEGRDVGAHRVSWELTHGALPAGAFVLHRCDNPPCVRPDHLFLGSAKSNTQDMLRKGRHRVERGAQHHAARLGEDEALEIRLRAASGASQHALAAEFCISPQAVNDIVRGRAWRHVGGPVGSFKPSLETVRLLVELAEKRGTSLEAELALAVQELTAREEIR